jgi:hypothetical protein
MIEGIGRDKISDLTTNVIRANLIEYTQAQCNLHGVPVQNVAVAPCFDPDTLRWEAKYADLPVWKGLPIVLVPRAVARYGIAYDHQNYYRHYVLNFLQVDALEAGSSLVRTLKNGRQVVRKNARRRSFPVQKIFCIAFPRITPRS